MKDNHTDITIVLDRSGSMSDVLADTIGGFNRFLKDQREAPGTACLTLHQFDNVFETLMAAVDVKAARDLTTKTYVPRGGTALLDAIGRAVNDTGARLSAIPEPARPGKVVFVIVTDGHENASREFNAHRITEMIRLQREQYAWEFVFLGANQDAITVAQGMGMAGANAMKYAHNAKGTESAFAGTSANLVQMRSGSKRDMSYTAKQREDQVKAEVEP